MFSYLVLKGTPNQEKVSMGDGPYFFQMAEFQQSPSTIFTTSEVLGFPDQSILGTNSDYVCSLKRRGNQGEK
jgi:hypothetical protein